MICLGLQELHQLNIVHKSISSDNIVVQTQDDQKVKFLLTNVNLCSYDQHNRVVNAPFFSPLLSPELAGNMPFNQKADIWTLGCFIYKLIAKCNLFKEPTQNEMLQQIQNCEQSYVDNKVNMLQIDTRLQDILKSMICVNINVRLNIFQVLERYKFFYKKQGQIIDIIPISQIEENKQSQIISQLYNNIEGDAILTKISKIVLEENLPEENRNNIINKLNYELANILYNKTQKEIEYIKSKLILD